VPGYKDNGYSIIIDLTGELEGGQGFLQTETSFHGDDALYIFKIAEVWTQLFPKL